MTARLEQNRKYKLLNVMSFIVVIKENKLKKAIFSVADSNFS